MKGKNTLKLNEPTMLAAVQMWVDSAFTSKPRVVAVRVNIGYSQSNDPTTSYEIDVDDGEKDDKKSPGAA